MQTLLIKYYRCNESLFFSLAFVRIFVLLIMQKRLLKHVQPQFSHFRLAFPRNFTFIHVLCPVFWF